MLAAVEPLESDSWISILSVCLDGFGNSFEDFTRAPRESHLQYTMSIAFAFEPAQNHDIDCSFDRCCHMTNHWLVLLVLLATMSKGNSAPTRTNEAAFAASAGSGESVERNIANDNEIPLLPASDPNSNIPSLKLGETMRFEEMGPIIINLDGTTRRIDNWNEMTKHEQEVSWRRLAKRNDERRKMLMEKMQQESSDSKDQE